MISSVKNIQILVSLLKQHDIKHIVVSPGSRDFQLVHSFETNDFFRCYTIVDERSAGFFAVGLSLALNRPVCVCCTSSTAASNYFAATVEAYKTSAQLVLLTADRDYRRLYQLEDQMIDQPDMYGDYVRCSVNIPIIRDDDDTWYTVRKINEAILELEHNGKKGPVQINYQLMDLGAPFLERVPEFRKITRYEKKDVLDELCELKEFLSSKKRIMIICGQNYGHNGIEAALEKFFDVYNCVIVKDNYSNLRSTNFLKTVLVTERMSVMAMEDYAPDFVITIGGHIWSFLKYTLQDSDFKFEHWRINEDGYIIDPFKRLTKVFECDPAFLINLLSSETKSHNNLEYYNIWVKRIAEYKYPDMKHSNFMSIRQLCDVIPDNALIHTSILNAVRLFDYSCINKDVLSFSNLGADGIDGCLPTFLGEASMIEERPAFLITGDLSLFYSMNSLCGSIPSNIHIFLINNYAGSEFHTNFGKFYTTNLSVDDHIAAGHSSNAEKWAESNGLKYYSANSHSDLQKQIDSFVNDKTPCLFEVFTNADNDAATLQDYYEINKRFTPKMYYRKGKAVIKQFFKKYF